MAEAIETVRHFATLEEAERARQFLEDNNFRPTVIDESHMAGNSNRGVYALQVPESQIEAAEALLDELPATEEEEAIEMLEDWEEESEEMREKFEQM